MTGLAELHHAEACGRIRLTGLDRAVCEAGLGGGDGGASLIADHVLELVEGRQADVLGVPVVRPAATELTVLGAAGLAVLHTGVWTEPEEFLAARGQEYVFEPDPDADSLRGEEVRGWRRAVRTAIHWARLADDEGD